MNNQHKTAAEQGARLKAWRISKGLSQEAAGELLGVTFQQWQKYEMGLNSISAVALHTLGDQEMPVNYIIYGNVFNNVEKMPFDSRTLKIAARYRDAPPNIKNAITALLRI